MTITLAELKAYNEALYTFGSITAEQQALLDRLASIDLLSTTIAIIEQRDATITAQSRLLALAETLSEAAAELIGLKLLKDTDGKTTAYEQRQPKAWEAIRRAFNAFIAAKADFTFSGAVPCGECEALKADKAALIAEGERLDAEYWGARTERDTLKAQLAEANRGHEKLMRDWDTHQAWIKQSAGEFYEQLQQAQADNAALVEDVNRLIALIEGGDPAHEYSDGERGNYMGNIVHPDWISDEKERAEADHPGAALLEEVEARRKVEEGARLMVPVTSSFDGRSKTVEALTELDAIRNREGR